MSSFERCDVRVLDPVELLLRRVVDRALLGSLVTLTAACSDGTGRERSMDPITGVDSGGFLIPVPISPRDAAADGEVQDAALEDAAVAEDAAADAQTDASEFPLGAFDPCSRGAGFPVRASGLTLAIPADYLAVRVATGIQGAPDDVESWDSQSFTVVSERGNACATATSNACAQKVTRHPDMLEQSYCVQACDEWSLVTTRGDDVERWATPPQLLDLLGAIDSDDDALMLAASSGYDVTCPAPGDSSKRESLRYVRTTAEGRELIGIRYASTCPIIIRRVRVLVTAAGEVRELETSDFGNTDNGCVGRVPAGLRAVPSAPGVAGYLARSAHLEAASVFAFERLADELAAHGAPSALVERAHAAARDEVRHARAMTKLARARGAVVEDVCVQELPVRTLGEIARENAVEGCVRETYGALVGAWQAARASDRTLRAVMEPIAADEARHAQLSHDVHSWLMTQLDEEERAWISEAQRQAIAALFAEPGGSCDELGLPDAVEARVLLRALEQELWASDHGSQALVGGALDHAQC